MTRPPEFWDAILRRLTQDVPAHEVEAWILPLHAEADGKTLRLLCPSALHCNRVRDRYLEPIRQAVRLHAEEAGEDAPVVRLALADSPPPERRLAKVEPDEANVPEAGASEAPARVAARAGLREPAPRRMARAVQQSFDNFVVGPPNALAREAAVALAAGSQREVNPLYLAGDSGLGKTHLARSVAGTVRRTDARVLYTSAEGFTSDFLGSLRNREVPRFKRRYREDCDVLVLEDVDFLGGKESTQLELFHTVAHLLDTGARVVFTGARLPREIPALDRRLGAQMASGLVAELAPPDTELRRSILKNRAAAGGIRIPEDCVERIVEAVRGSVSDLESVLGQIVASATLLKQPVDLALTDAALRKLGPGESRTLGNRRVAPREVIEMVAAFFGTTPEALCSRSRRRDILLPRQLSMYLCRRFTDASFSEIGRALERDHPSVRNAVSSVERQILERAPLRYQVEALCDRLEHLRGER